MKKLIRMSSIFCLQVFDDGHLTDAKGRRVDFRNAIIVMTSNIGAETIRKGAGMGFATKTDETKQREAELRPDEGKTAG